MEGSGEVAAPPEGGETGNGLYDLEGAPEELRPYLAQELKKVEQNTNKKFQEHAAYRQQWEPYGEIEGLQDMSPQDVQQLIEFAQMAQNPEQFKEWLGQAASEVGWEPEMDAERWAQIGEERGFNETQEPEDTTQQDQLMQQFQQMLDERLGPIENVTAEQQYERNVQTAREEIESEFAQLEHEYGEGSFDRERVAQLARSYDHDPDAIRKGLEDYLQITGQAQGSLMDQKAQQPAGAMSGGQPDTAPPETHFGDGSAKSAARARFGVR